MDKRQRWRSLQHGPEVGRQYVGLGNNSSGQLGDGTDVVRTSPVQVSADNFWAEFAPGNLHSFAIKPDRSQFCATGTNYDGQLGDNTLLNKLIFVCSTDALALPLTFMGISANRTNAGVQVSWKVTGERNMRSYDVERSTNSRDFATAASLPAAGNLSLERNYSWIDVNAVAGTLYYHVKGIGLTGETKYTGIVKLTSANGKQGFVVSPNPVEGGMMNLQFYNQPQGRYTIRILNITGQTIYNRTVIHPGGYSTQIISLPPGLASGTYQVQLEAPGNTVTGKSLFINNK